MNTSSNTQTPMNATQMMLLRLFSRPVPEQRMKEIKKITPSILYTKSS